MTPAENGFFDAEWYAWQNPDRIAGQSAEAHYLAVGRHQGRDPSPMVDMTRFLDVTAGTVEPSTALDLIAGGLNAPALGVYGGWSDLAVAQERFRTTLSCICHRHTGAQPRENLVVLQAGPGSRHRDWFRDGPRSWDLLVNWYDPSAFDPEIGEFVFFQPGTKFTAMHRLMTAYPALLLRYRAVLFLDDDITFEPAAPDRLFAAMTRDGIDLAQMALSEGSHTIWTVLLQSGARGWRELNAVEIMMPALSRRGLRAIAQDLQHSISGFGLDVLWGKRITEAGLRAGVCDEVVATHDRPIDDRSGAYYRLMRDNLLNPKAELWRILRQHGADREIRACA